MAKKSSDTFVLARRDLILALTAFLLGAIWFFGLRFILVNKPTTHYHANFGLYVNGVRDPFVSPSFYEEVVACSSDSEKNNPRQRVHMHGQVSDVVHVHDTAVTWGHFFANLGYNLGNSVLITDDGTFVDGVNGAELTFMLNGEVVETVANRVISSEDVLLVAYGADDPTALQGYYNAVPRDAADYNKQHDPGACTGDEAEKFSDRFKRTLGID